jgi:hypothetical protein
MIFASTKMYRLSINSIKNCDISQNSKENELRE